MSQVTEESKIYGLTAGNTVHTLASVDRDAAAGVPSSADLDAVAAEQAIGETTSVPVESVPSASEAVEEFLDEENTFDVNRAEFNELRDLVLSVAHGISQFNIGAPHKIPTQSINSRLGIR